MTTRAQPQVRVPPAHAHPPTHTADSQAVSRAVSSDIRLTSSSRSPAVASIVEMPGAYSDASRCVARSVTPLKHLVHRVVVMATALAIGTDRHAIKCECQIVVDVCVDAEEHVLQDQVVPGGGGVEAAPPRPGHLCHATGLVRLQCLTIEIRERNRVALYPDLVGECATRQAVAHLRRHDAVQGQKDAASILPRSKMLFER